MDDVSGIIGAPDRFIGREMHGVGAVAAVEHEHLVLFVHGDVADFFQVLVIRQLRPAGLDPKLEIA